MLQRRMLVATCACAVCFFWAEWEIHAQVVYWCNHSSGCLDDGISSARLDDALPDFVHRGRCTPIGLAVDEGVNAIYWSDESGLFRSALNGDDIVEIVARTNSSRPGAVALDRKNETLYWTDWARVNIFRSELDGSNPTPVVTDVGVSSVLYIDTAFDKLYWVEQGASIFRANLDGTNIEPVRSRIFGNITGVSVDPFGLRLYWSEQDAGVFRSGLDGLSPESVVPDGALALYLDALAGQLYWTELQLVMRSNLDGSEPEPVVEGMLGETALRFPFFGLVVDNRIPGDCEGDGQLGLSDMGTFVGCVGGPGVEMIRGCGCADIDRNGRTTLKDYAAFQLAIGE